MSNTTQAPKISYLHPDPRRAARTRAIVAQREGRPVKLEYRGQSTVLR